MNPNKALWEQGDFTKIAVAMRESGERFVDKLEIRPGMKVLDLGCGDGTTAIPIAQRGALVLGIDIAENLVAAGTARAKEIGLPNITFRTGDASALTGVQTGAFDLTVSLFGAMFAPRPFDTAKEMVRVTRPGGQIVMGNWIPGDPTLVAQLLKISASFSPPPPDGFVSPTGWGIDSMVTERFAAAGLSSSFVKFKRESYTFDYSGTPSAFLAQFRQFYGPTMNAFAAAEASGRVNELSRQLETLFAKENTSGTYDRTIIPATFLKVTATVG
jgi:SAM-dependent methyltransferase